MMDRSLPNLLRTALRGAVLLLSLFCLVWVLRPIFRHGEELLATTDGAALLAGVVLGALLYALLAVLLALAWWWLAGLYGRAAPFRVGYGIWARSQLGKYLPGNAFHFVSRQLLGREAGFSHPALVASGLLELGSLLLAAVLLGAWGGFAARLPAGTPGSGAALPVWVLGAGAVCLLLWPALDRILRRLPRTRAWMEDLPPAGVLATLRLLGPSLVLHILFFAGTGALLVGLLASGWEVPAGAFRLVWVFPIAWAAGTLAAGAPAGVGVREAVLLLQLEPLCGPARAAALVVALRLVTTGGDLLTGLAGWWVGRRSTLPDQVRP